MYFYGKIKFVRLVVFSVWYLIPRLCIFVHSRLSGKCFYQSVSILIKKECFKGKGSEKK